MAWASAEDLINSWIGPGAPDEDEADRIDLWLGRAERKVRAAIPDLQDRLDAEAEAGATDLLETVRDVVVSMVTRVFRNPRGIRQAQESGGPFQGSITYGGDHPGDLYITDDERGMLTGTGEGPQAFEVDMMLGSVGPRAVPRWDGWA